MRTPIDFRWAFLFTKAPPRGEKGLIRGKHGVSPLSCFFFAEGKGTGAKATLGENHQGFPLRRSRAACFLNDNLSRQASDDPSGGVMNRARGGYAASSASVVAEAERSSLLQSLHFTSEQQRDMHFEWKRATTGPRFEFLSEAGKRATTRAGAPVRRISRAVWRGRRDVRRPGPERFLDFAKRLSEGENLFLRYQGCSSRVLAGEPSLA